MDPTSPFHSNIYVYTPNQTLSLVAEARRIATDARAGLSLPGLTDVFTSKVFHCYILTQFFPLTRTFT